MRTVSEGNPKLYFKGGGDVLVGKAHVSLEKAVASAVISDNI